MGPGEESKVFAISVFTFFLSLLLFQKKKSLQEARSGGEGLLADVFDKVLILNPALTCNSCERISVLSG